MFSCDSQSSTPEHDASEREALHHQLTREEALAKAKAALLKQNKEIDEKLKVIDRGDYYTVTPDIPPFMVGGGWSVDVNSDSGEILKIYYAE